MEKLLYKALSCLKNDGPKMLVKRTFAYIRKMETREIEPAETVLPEKIPEKRNLVDVLFIDGCGSVVPHPPRYRITHQREQLEAGNVSTDQVYYLDLSLDMIRFANVFVFFRCPCTEVVEEFIKLAKQIHKTVIFDVDDLVIDTKYTDMIPYVRTMPSQDRAQYDRDVVRMGKTLKMCDCAVTTTRRLAEELRKYNPEVVINRNTASEKMYGISEATYKKREDNEVRIGYFSGSITHNNDFIMVLPVLKRLLQKYDNLFLYIVGELDIPDELETFSDRINVSPFLDWEELPQLIASVDINIAPLENSIFNEAKSENKWVEAALVKVPTVASDLGAFAEMIEHGKTGFLCRTQLDWEEVLERLIQDQNLRKSIANQAYLYVKEHCVTIYSGHAYVEYIRQKMNPSVLFALPSTEISGGMMVAFKHAAFLQKAGQNVHLIAFAPAQDWIEYDSCKFPVVDYMTTRVQAYYDKAIATMWSTTDIVEHCPKTLKWYYLVQNYEVDFYEPDNIYRIMANRTYNLGEFFDYVTISKWCQTWLKDKYDLVARYAPNGIEVAQFRWRKRNLSNNKIRILIEGDCSVYYKQIDESFRITNKLDKEKFEIWYMSYNSPPKSWYDYDRFFHKVAYAEVVNVYSECDILIKSSTLESFSYPPLEMMATGGYVVAVQNGGNAEYLKDEYNCLVYESGNEEQAIDCINRLLRDERLRLQIEEGAINTVKKRDWEMLKLDILNLYQVEGIAV